MDVQKLFYIVATVTFVVVGLGVIAASVMVWRLKMKIESFLKLYTRTSLVRMFARLLKLIF